MGAIVKFIKETVEKEFERKFSEEELKAMIEFFLKRLDSDYFKENPDKILFLAEIRIIEKTNSAEIPEKSYGYEIGENYGKFKDALLSSLLNKGK